MNKFILKNSESQPGWWTLAIPEYGITFRFREHEFNETQEISLYDPTIVDNLGPEGIASLMREAGDWLFSHAYSVAMPTPVFEFRRDDDADKHYILRNKFPRLKIEVREECSYKQLADALRSGSEYVKRLKADRKSGAAPEQEFVISLPDDMAEAIRDIAKEEGISPEEILKGMIEGYFEDYDEDE